MKTLEPKPSPVTLPTAGAGGRLEKEGFLCYDDFVMEEHGVVVQCRGDIAVIRAERTTACDSCSSKELCISGKGEQMLVEASNPVGATPGQRVAFAVSSASVMKAGLVLYLVPVVFFIIGVLLGRFAGGRFLPDENADLVSGFSGVIFLVVAYLCVKFYGKFSEKSGSSRPRILRVE